jgi:anaerobic magnesium-protoporphyrin IX monomethyl ester cyclase
MIFLTHGYFLNEDAKEQEIMKPYVPLGILYISSYLQQKGIENKVFDSTFSSFEKLQTELLNTQPGIVAIYTNLMTKLNVLKIISFVKKELKNSKVILGGPEIRYYSEDYLRYGADMVVIGEGEETMFEICSYYKVHKSFPQDCDGTAFLKNKELVTNKDRVLIKDINTLPFPDRSKVDLKLYLDAWKKYHGKSMISVSTMRGCPYTCKWCSRAVYGGTYRRRAPELVAEELLRIKKEYAPDAVWFVDDVFTISHKWLKEFVACVKEKNAVIPYEIITRADRMNEEVVKLLKESGCFRVWIGAESGSQKIIDAMDRRVEVQTVRDMIILSKSYGIEAGTFIMLGYPGETKKDIKETIKHLQLSNPDYYTVTIAYPIKGTLLYNEIEKEIYTNYDFSVSTDRDIDFKRTHSKNYYKYAVRWVYNEVHYNREPQGFNKVKIKLKSQLAQILMKINS